MRILREEWGIPFGLPAPAWLLEAGALLIRTESELLLKSRRVVPGLLRERGFAFAFPTWRLAARELCARWRLGNGAALPRVQDVAG
jgi:NAD dependent epimerase/dehydratase family enzyme